MRALVVTLAAAGCYNPTIRTGVPCGPGDVCPGAQVCVAGVCEGTGDIDASLVDGDGIGIDGSGSCGGWSPEHFDACSIPQAPADLVLDITNGSYSWDTDTGELKKGNNVIPVTTMVLTQTNGPSVRLATVNNFTLQSNVDLNIVGTRPLLIAAWGNVTIAGFIELSAVTSTPGPGGSLTTYCTGSTGTNGPAATPAKGGGGGSFQGMGGTGGNTGGAGGAPIALSSIIRGGCSGGLGPAGGSSGPRGAGGGAIQISARQAITVTGTIHAGGGGGGSGRYNATTLTTGGAGGGGSGGYIGLDAPTITVAGSLAANGGGGGGGSSDVQNGLAGTNGRTDAVAASGGPGATSSFVGACVPGGNGAAGASLNGVSAGSSGCGGSGGGGGAGYIYVWSSTYSATGTVSPPKTVGP